MDRTIEPIEGSPFTRMKLRMASPEERDSYAKTIPDPMPATHIPVVRWEWDGKNAFLVLETVPKPESSETRKLSESEPTVPPGMEAKRKELEGMSLENLATHAATLGVKVDPKMRKPALVAATLAQIEANEAGKAVMA